MAIKDVKQYYYSMQAQYLEMKADLQDFEEALAAGYITEEQLEAASEDIRRLEENYDRLTYIMYLLEIPTRVKKRTKHSFVNAPLLKAFSERSATQIQVEEENRSALDHLRNELKRLKEAGQ